MTSEPRPLDGTATTPMGVFSTAHAQTMDKTEGLTTKKHEDIMMRAEELIHIDPMELLAEHRSLLEVDFEHLGEGPAEDRQYWNAEMESAIAAGGHIRRGSRQALRSRYCNGPRPRMRVVDEVAVVDNEGSIRWRRRRRRT